MKTVPTATILAATLRSIGDGVISCGRDGRVYMMNRVAEELTGWTEAEAAGHLLKEVFVIANETTREPVEDPVDKVLRFGTVVGMANHTILMRRDGTELAIDDSAAPIHNEEGELRGVVLVFRDVTERREAEWNLELLAKSGRVLAEARDATSILDRIDALITEHFADLAIFDLLLPSGDFERHIGRHRVPEYQSIVQSLHHFTPNKEFSAHPARAALYSGRSVLLPIVSDDLLHEVALNSDHEEYLRNRFRPCSLLTVPIQYNGERLGAFTFVRNVMGRPFTEADRLAGEELADRIGVALVQERLRRQLRQEQARLKTILNEAPVGIVMAATSGKIVYANGESERILRHAIQPTRNIDQYDQWVIYHPDGNRVQNEEYPLVRAMASNLPIAEQDFLYQRSDGTKGWISISAAPLCDEDGRVFGGVAAIRDVDEQRRFVETITDSERALRRSEERFRALVERASIGIHIVDPGGKLSYANPALLKLIGYTRDEVERGELHWEQLTPPEFSLADRRALEELRTTGRATPYEKVYRAKDGHLAPILVGATVIPGLERAGDEAVAFFFTDLTRLKQAEAALVQAEKLAAVGKLASTISHEINNPLEAVTNLLFIVRQDASLSQSSRDYLEVADRELARVSLVTSQTLRFHRQSTAAMTVAPESLIEEVLQLYAARLTNARIAVNRAYALDTFMTCYEGDIRQVLNNLIGNAIDAMRSGGRMTVRTKAAKRWSTGEDGVRITIADSGAGMNRDVLHQIFEAFFTTKGISGTGLGLWIACRIVHKHRGYIRVYSSASEEHHGAVFALWLPRRLAETAKEPWHVPDGQRL